MPPTQFQFDTERKAQALFRIAVNKISLSVYDDKRYILPDGINILGYGQYRIGNIK